MKQGIPTRGVETDRRCPECGGGNVTRTGETVRERDGRILEERYHCASCRHAWSAEPEEVYRDG